MILEILKAVGSLSLMGLVLGGILAFASKVFAVKADERAEAVAGVLPGANCGGCGFAGCSAFAQAVSDGKAPVTGCTAGGNEVAAKVAAVMGVTAETVERRMAYVMCCGTADVSRKKYEYKGVMDCYAAVKIGGGERECPSSCLGLGTCVNRCPFGAIELIDSVAVVDKEKCSACGVCVASCPKQIIKMIPYETKYVVHCSSAEKGGEVRKYCTVGCIGCKLCEKACEYGAIAVENNRAVIDYAKCTGCGACAEKCPRKIIHPVEDISAFRQRVEKHEELQEKI